MRTAPLVLLLFPSVLACASAPPVGSGATPEDTAKVAAETPAQKCLAIAGAAREQKAGEPAKVGVRHVLVRYRGAKNAPDAIARTREEACLRALEARDKILAQTIDFDQAVKDYSDEAGAADRRGAMGTLERREMTPPFADAAMELSIGQMSDVVETDFGFHLILRSE